MRSTNVRDTELFDVDRALTSTSLSVVTQPGPDRRGWVRRRTQEPVGVEGVYPARILAGLCDLGRGRVVRRAGAG